MSQKLIHWTEGAQDGYRNLHPDVHIRLSVESRIISAAFFVDADEFLESHPDEQIKGEADFQSLLSLNLAHPFIGGFSNVYDGSVVGLAAEHTVLMKGISYLNADSGNFGSAESDGPMLVAFPLLPDLSPVAPFGVLSDTVSSKRQSRWERLRTNQHWPVLAVLNNGLNELTSANILVRNTQGFGFKSNLTEWEEVGSAAGAEIVSTMHSLSIDSAEVTVAPGAIVDIPVRVVDYSGLAVTSGSYTIHAESTGGYLPLTRARTSNGEATLRVRALDIQSGEEFKVKVGFRNFTGCDEVTVKVQ